MKAPMHRNILFLIAGIIVFALAAFTGYYGPGWLASQRAAKEHADFVPAGVPRRVVAAFGRDFQTIEAAIEPKRLPEGDFMDTGGKTHKISNFSGRPTLVNFWATWCSPCVVELPSLQKLGEHYEGRMNVVSIALEEGRNPADIASFLEKRGVGDFAGYLDREGEIARNLGIRGIPTSFLIGSDGHILYRFEGDADWTSEHSKAFFDIFLLQNR